MPRQSRLDAPGLLQHVMARNSFLDRLADILEETQTHCYPWTGHSAILGRRKNPLLHTDPAKGGSSAEGGFSFSLSSRKGKKKEDPANPVNPVYPVAPVDGTGVKKEKPLAEKTIEGENNYDMIDFVDRWYILIYTDVMKRG